VQRDPFQEAGVAAQSIRDEVPVLNDSLAVSDLSLFRGSTSVGRLLRVF